MEVEGGASRHDCRRAIVSLAQLGGGSLSFLASFPAEGVSPVGILRYFEAEIK